MLLKDPMNQRLVREVGVLPVLAELGLPTETNGKTELRIPCPVHMGGDDNFSINRETGLWKCHSRCGGGDLVILWSRMRRVTIEETMTELDTRFLGNNPIEDYCARMLDGDFPKERALVPYGLRLGTGSHGPELRIPVYGPNGRMVNIKYRRLHPEDPSQKSRPLSPTKIGERKVSFGNGLMGYPCAKARPDLPILLCEGEKDMVAAAKRVTRMVPVSFAMGASSIPEGFGHLFQGRDLLVAYDEDLPGQDGAKRAEKVYGGYCRRVAVLRLKDAPHSLIDGSPAAKDLSDYLNHNHDVESFEAWALAQLEAVPYAEPMPTEEDDGRVEEWRRKTSFPTDALPERGFIPRYLAIVDRLTEAPDELHIGSLLGALGTIMSGNIWLKFSPAERGCLYTNLYTLTLAPSSVYHKGTASSLALRLVKFVNRDWVLPDEFTTESFVEHLTREPKGVIVHNELATLLSLFDKNYGDGLRPLLTNLYDCPEHYRRKLRSGDFDIHNPYLSVMASSTIDWLQERTKASDVHSGFLARFQTFSASSKKPPNPNPPNMSLDDRMYLESGAKYLASMTGEYVLSEGAAQVYEEWYCKMDGQMTKASDAAALSGPGTRLLTAAKKYALIFEASHGDDASEVSRETMERVVSLCDYLFATFACKILGQLHYGFGSQQVEKVRGIIQKAGVIRHSKALQNAHLRSRDFAEAVGTLLETGEIEEFPGAGGKSYRWKVKA